MKTQRLYYTIPFMCRMLNVSPSGYYAWLNRKPSRHVIEEVRLELEIKAAHIRTRGTFGPEKLQRYLVDGTKIFMDLKPYRCQCLKQPCH